MRKVVSKSKSNKKSTQVKLNPKVNKRNVSSPTKTKAKSTKTKKIVKQKPAIKTKPAIKSKPAKVKKDIKNKPKATKSSPRKKTTQLKVAALPLKAIPRRTITANQPSQIKSKSAPKQKKEPSQSGPKGYTSAEYEKFKQEKKKLDELSNQQLKDILRKNLQSMSGNKDQLVYKVADGRVLGRIPRCPNCFGGRPKFDYKLGTYYCSGYRDDQDFKNCHSSFIKEEIKRDAWEN